MWRRGGRLEACAAAVAMGASACGVAVGSITPDETPIELPSASADASAARPPASAVVSATAPTASAGPSVAQPSAPMEVKNAYQRRVANFLRGLWTSRCTDENATASGRATLTGLKITSVSDPSLEFLLGAEIPPPPEEYPDLYFPNFELSFTCPKKAKTQ